MVITKCGCGRRMSHYATLCNPCFAKKQAEWLERVGRANAILAKTRVILTTAFGPYVVQFFERSLDAICYPEAVLPQNARVHQRTFALHGGHVEQVLAGKDRI